MKINSMNEEIYDVDESWQNFNYFNHNFLQFSSKFMKNSEFTLQINHKIQVISIK